MVGSFIRFAAAASFSLTLAACAGSSGDYAVSYQQPVTRGTHVSPSYSGPHEECVPYARARSGIPVYGDAWTWWEQTEGKYAHNSEPTLGAVLVLTGYAGPHRAHLAYVSSMVSSREIRIDHANWLNDGDVFTDDPVVDVSPGNDWSEVRVFNPRSGTWGIKTYIVQGFIGPGGDNQQVALSY
jgi:surface antigen